MPSKDERVELEMKIVKTRQLARSADDTTRERLEPLAAELEQHLKEIDESWRPPHFCIISTDRRVLRLNETAPAALDMPRRPPLGVPLG
jgi:hypothetical protein